jgi:hypothetical protein
MQMQCIACSLCYDDDDNDGNHHHCYQFNGALTRTYGDGIDSVIDIASSSAKASVPLLTTATASASATLPVSLSSELKPPIRNSNSNSFNSIPIIMSRQSHTKNSQNGRRSFSFEDEDYLNEAADGDDGGGEEMDIKSNNNNNGNSNSDTGEIQIQIHEGSQSESSHSESSRSDRGEDLSGSDRGTPRYSGTRSALTSNYTSESECAPSAHVDADVYADTVAAMDKAAQEHIMGMGSGSLYSTCPSPTEASRAHADSFAHTHANAGPLSPFSPLLKKAPAPSSKSSPSRLSNSNTRTKQLQWKHLQPDNENDDDDFELSALSMAACRRVSVVVSVNPPTMKRTRTNKNINNSNSNDSEPEQDAGEKLCLFPLVDPHADLADISGTAGTKQHLSPTSATFQRARDSDARDLVVVNPTAFGRFIPSQVTMETAKLVAQIAHIQTEDWARIFRFHQVLWPGNDSSSSTMNHLTQAVVNDVTVAGSISVRTVVGMGGGNCETTTESLFGVVGTQSIAQVFSQSAIDLSEAQILERYGMLGLATKKILAAIGKTTRTTGEKETLNSVKSTSTSVCTLSLLEIAEEDVLYDLLAAKPFAGKTTKSAHEVKLRYSGERHGAKVEGLSDVPLDSLKGLGHSLRRAFSVALHKKRKQNRGHIIATLKVWPKRAGANTNATAGGENNRYTAIQFVDLATVENENSTANAQRNASIRKSTSTLGGILRSLLLKEAGNETMITYRESTLTKVLQRSLDHPDSRVIMLANVSPISDAYDDTMSTLRYVSRLLYRPGQTAQSPFDTPSKGTSPTSPTTTEQSPINLDKFTGGGDLLAHMLSDPRQRLAKVMKPSRAKVPVSSKPLEAGVGTYIPTRYMEVDPATVCPPPDEKLIHSQNGKQPELSPTQYNSSLPTPVARNGERQGGFRKGGERGTDGEPHSVEPSKGRIHEHFVDTSYALDDMEPGNYDVDYNLGPSPLTADTGEGYLNSDRFALDDMSRSTLERNQRLLSEASNGHERDRGGEYEAHDIAAENVSSKSYRSHTIPVDMPTSNLMGWNDDIGDLTEQDSEAQDTDDLSAELFNRNRTMPNNTSTRRDGRESPNTQEMDDLSAELFRKKDPTTHEKTSTEETLQSVAMVDVDVNRGIQNPRKIELEGLEHVDRRYSSHSTINSSLPSQKNEEGEFEERGSTILSREEKTRLQVEADTTLASRNKSGASNSANNDEFSVQQAMWSKLKSEGEQAEQEAEVAQNKHEDEEFEKRVSQIISQQEKSQQAMLSKPNSEREEAQQEAEVAQKSGEKVFESNKIPREEKTLLRVEVDKSWASRNWSEDPNSANNDEFLRAQQAMLSKLKSERVQAQQEAEVARSNLKRQSQEHQRELQQREQEVADLQEKVGMAQRNRDDESLHEQHAMIAKLNSEREQIQQEAEAAKRELEYQSQEYRREAQRREKEVAELQEKGRKAEGDRDDESIREQQAMIEELNLEREKTRQEAEATHRELERKAEEYRRDLQRREQEVAELQEKVGKVENERCEVLKIAEEAIGTQSELEDRVTHLEEELSMQASRSVPREDLLRLEESNVSLSQDLHDMRSEISQYKTELNQRNITISELQLAVSTFEKERAHLLDRQSQDKQDMQRLASFGDKSQDQKKEAVGMRNEISRLQRENDSMLASKQRRESELLRQLADKDAYIQRCKQETENLHLELVTLRDIERSEKSQLESGQRKVATLQERLAELEEELAFYQSQQGTYEQRSEEEKLSKVAFEDELKRTRDNLNLRISDVQELSTNLKSVLAEKEQDELKIADMHRTLESFRNETRTRVERVVQHRNEAVTLLEKTLQEKQVLAEANHELESALKNVRGEDEIRGRSNHTNYDLQSALETMRREREEMRLLKDQTNHELHSEVENMKREREDMRTRHDQINHELQNALENMRRERDEVRANHDQYDREEPSTGTAPSRGEPQWRSGTARERDEPRVLPKHHEPRHSESTYGDRWERAIAQEESRERDEPHGLPVYQQPRDAESSYGDRWERSRAIIPEEPYPLYERSEPRERTTGDSLERYRYGEISGNDNFNTRAEELTAYMAVSAKESMERRNAETFQLQQQLYALEVSKAAEKEALMARIRGLERNQDPTGYS